MYNYTYKKQQNKSFIFYVNFLLSYGSNFTKCLKNQPYDVIKMREMRKEVGKKIPKKEMDNPSFYNVTWLIFETQGKIQKQRENFKGVSPKSKVKFH